MGKLQYLVCLVIVAFGLSLTCTSATTYTVGDTSGWDISSDLDTWVLNKRFIVGDVLVFQYSSSDSLSEVIKENFDACNTTNVITTYSNGNTTIPLTKAGDRYFISGNRFYCLGGMKLQVKVEGNQATSPVAAPQATPGQEPGSTGTTTQPSSKSDTPTVFPSSSARTRHGLPFMGFIVALGTSLVWTRV